MEIKNKILPVLILLCLLSAGCSKNQTTDNSSANGPGKQTNAAIGKMLQNFVVVESAETKEKKEIDNQAKALFDAKDFDKLDSLAVQYRESRECYADGNWKLSEVYRGLQLPDKASDSEWESHLAVFNDWIKARPESITARVALADELMGYAWKARGSGYAKTVSGIGWQLFTERLQHALTVLRDAKTLKEGCPYWGSTMLRIELGLGTERSQYEALFKDIVHTYPDYSRYYTLRATYLLPRWHGRSGEWEADLVESANKIGGEEGDLLYARVVWNMQQQRIFDNIFKESKLSWERIARGFAVIEKRYPDSLAAKSERAFLTALGGPVNEAESSFNKLDGKVDLSVWMDRDEFDTFARWAYGP